MLFPQNRSFRTGVATLLFLAIMAPFSAKTSFADYRIATVDITRIMNDSVESKELKAKLDKLSLEAKDEIEVEKKKLEDFQRKLQDKKEGPTTADAERYQKMAREFSRTVKDTEEDLKREFMKSNQNLTEKTLRLIESYAKRNQIDLVLDKSLKTRGPVLFGTESVDITDAIIKELGNS